LECRRLLAAAQPTLNLDADSDSGIVGDLITNVSAPTLSGSGISGNTIYLYDGTSLVGTSTVSGTGQWSLTLSDDLLDGTHALRASASDPAGNVSPFSRTLNVFI